ncbi:conserved hypothetical protein, precursor [Deinococcus proteolyticus MRP]|uniref:Copper amine oxidase-like N-terminal domain-containing protein n=1 Tax=Deinococcus proteolyticus (strain ATCC 35074 / DSM 20540 / JCM 6276 / NBRC 101906 / NCIMB 13154 / VKM Ac-1939 / CCM 2703 / MRP) TaxID=693977 RepID=F0RNM2_DEIPM|nr:hypothetical protein [Deinococcus proteolyticus]ADY26348.1 conserved hypothetical protein, precursor [Deinococcus proteolyticus MRP]
MTTPALRSGRLLRPALLGLCALLPVAAAQATPQAPVPPTAAASAPAAAAVPTPAQQAAQARARLALPDPGLSRLAAELRGAVGGRLYRCPPSLRLPAQAVCLYARGERAELQSRIAAQLGDRVLGQWQAQGPLLNLLLRADGAAETGAAETGAASEYVALLDLGEGDHLLILNTEPAAAAVPATPVPTTPGEVELYLTPADLIGVVRVQHLGGQNYRLTPQGGTAADVQVGALELAQGGTITPLPLPLRIQGSELYIPASVLRTIGCVLSPTEGALTVACGRTSVGVTPRRL